MDFSKADEKDADSELVFDGPDLEDALADLLADTPARPSAATATPDQDQLADLMDFIPAETAPPARPKAPRKAAAIADMDLSAMLGDIAPAPAPVAPPAADAPPVEQPVAEAKAEPAPPVSADAPKPDRLTRLALPVAAVAAVLSSVGVVVTAHNLSTLAAQQATLDARIQSMAAIPTLVSELKRVTAQTRAELKMAAARRPADAATRTDVDRGLDALRNALSKMQAPGTAALAGVVREGQTELAGEIDKLNDRIDSIEDRRSAAHH